MSASTATTERGVTLYKSMISCVCHDKRFKKSRFWSLSTPWFSRQSWLKPWFCLRNLKNKEKQTNNDHSINCTIKTCQWNCLRSYPSLESLFQTGWEWLWRFQRETSHRRQWAVRKARKDKSRSFQASDDSKWILMLQLLLMCDLCLSQPLVGLTTVRWLK